MKRQLLTLLFILFTSVVLFAQYQIHETKISSSTSAPDFHPLDLEILQNSPKS
jgi:energy-converting hydrogenase Eha subunit G